MKVSGTSTFLAVSVLLASVYATSYLTVEKNDAMEIANLICGNGVTITSAKIVKGRAVQYGTFKNGASTVGFNKGAILATGNIKEATFDATNSEFNAPGWNPLTKLTGQTTCDAIVYETRFKCPWDKQYVAVNYVFASNDYPSDGNSDYDDVMGIFLNGQAATNNIAIANGKYVSVNTLYEGPKYVDNDPLVRDINADGLTIPLKTKVVKGKEENVIKFAVADGYDAQATAYLFIREKGLQCVPKPH